jgi:TetR/AcrR family transcriptional regulator, lmrAB and yxaGH operons repressor
MADAVDSRTRLIGAMQEALQVQGFAATGLSALLERAQAPKGVLYHHFPGGKLALAEAALEASGARVLAALEQLFARVPDPADALNVWTNQAAQTLKRSGFARGCPLATVALETAAREPLLAAVVERQFSAMTARIAEQMVRVGHAPEVARSFATLAVAAYEGGLLLARAARDLNPFLTTMHTLIQSLPRRP